MLKDDLIRKYGPTMRVQDLAEVLRCTTGNIYNKLSKGTFEIDTFKVGGKVMADTTEVADYIQTSKIESRLK